MTVHSLTMSVLFVFCLIFDTGCCVPNMFSRRQVSLFWDTDNSNGVTDIPSGIIHAPSVPASHPPPTGNNGFAVNVYGNKGYFPHFTADGTAINGGLPQACNLSLHVARLKADIEQLIPDSKFSGMVNCITYSRNIFWESNRRMAWIKRLTLVLPHLNIACDPPVGVCLLDYEQMRADWNSTEDIYRNKTIEVGE